MSIFDDSKFVKLVEDTWGLAEAKHLKVDPKNVEALVNAMRSSLQKFASKGHTDEFVLREIFRQFDRDSNGVLTSTEISGLFKTLGIGADEAHV